MNLDRLLGGRFVAVGVLLGPLSSLMNCLVILVGLRRERLPSLLDH